MDMHEGPSIILGKRSGYTIYG